MESLFDLTVEGILSSNTSAVKFEELPAGIRESLVPALIRRLTIIDELRQQNTQLQQKKNELESRNNILSEENARLNQKVDRLEANRSYRQPQPHYPDYLAPPRPRPPPLFPPSPSFTNFEPPLGRAPRHPNEFTFSE